MIFKTFSTGQLCNQIYDLATFISSRPKNKNLVYNGFHEYLPYFRIGTQEYQDVLNISFTPKWSKNLIRKSHKLIHSLFVGRGVKSLLSESSFPLTYGTLSARLNLIGGCWYTHFEAVKQNREELIKAFAPIIPIQNSINEIVNPLYENYDLLVGVHVRRGDYKTFEGGKYYFDDEVYFKLMEAFERLHLDKKVGFLICSNELLTKSKWAKESFHFEPREFIEDLYSLSKCDFIIGPPSTFSMWASFYGNTPLFQIYSEEMSLKMDQFIVYEVY